MIYFTHMVCSMLLAYGVFYFVIWATGSLWLSVALSAGFATWAGFDSQRWVR